MDQDIITHAILNDDVDYFFDVLCLLSKIQYFIRIEFGHEGCWFQANQPEKHLLGSLYLKAQQFSKYLVTERCAYIVDVRSLLRSRLDNLNDIREIELIGREHTLNLITCSNEILHLSPLKLQMQFLNDDNYDLRAAGDGDNNRYYAKVELTASVFHDAVLQLDRTRPDLLRINVNNTRMKWQLGSQETIFSRRPVEWKRDMTVQIHVDVLRPIVEVARDFQFITFYFLAGLIKVVPEIKLTTQRLSLLICALPCEELRTTSSSRVSRSLSPSLIGVRRSRSREILHNDDDDVEYKTTINNNNDDDVEHKTIINNNDDDDYEQTVNGLTTLSQPPAVDQSSVDQSSVDQSSVDQSSVDQSSVDQSSSSTIDQTSVDQTSSLTMDQTPSSSTTVDQSSVDQSQKPKKRRNNSKKNNNVARKKRN